MNLKEKAAKGVLWSAIQKWGEQTVSFIVFLLLARLLGPETYGLVALASLFLAFVQLFLDQGFATAIIQREDLETEHLDTAFWVSIGFSVLLLLICVMSADLVAVMFKEPQVAPVIRWLSLSFIFQGLNSVQGAILRRNLNFKLLAIRSLIGILVGGVVGVVMALLDYGVWSLVGQQLSNLIIGVPLLWWVSDWRPGLNVSAKHFKDLFSYGVNITAFGVLNFFNRRSDNLLIGFFLGTVQLGYYTVAYRILNIMVQLLTNITAQVALPAFSRMQNNPERMRNAFYTVTQLTSLISFPAFIAVAVLAPELVRVFFGEKWLPSIPVMQVLSLIGILESLYYFNSTVLLAAGKANWRLWINCWNAATNVIAFAIAVRWGIVAVAAAYAIRGYLFSPIALIVIRKLIDISYVTYLRQYIAPLTASIAMTIVIYGIKYLFSDLLNLYGFLAISIVLGLAVYVAMLQLLAPSLLQKIINLIMLALPKSKLKGT